MKIKFQKGVGMIEVLVALVILAIGVLGFAALQLRAVDATNEAMSKVEAMNLARDLAERIRANRISYATYKANLTATTQSNTATSCVQTGSTTPCTTAVQMANYDTAQIIEKAQSLGMTINLPGCQVAKTLDSTGVATTVDRQSRSCVYVAWGETKAIDSSTDSSACTNGSSYLPQARCVVMELY